MFAQVAPRKLVQVLGILLSLSLFGCQKEAPKVNPSPLSFAGVEQRILERIPALESVTPRPIYFQQRVKIPIRIRAGHTLSREQVLECMDMLAQELQSLAESVVLIDQMGVDHSARLLWLDGRIVREGQLLELTLAEEARRTRKAQNALDIAMPGRTRVSVSLLVDGWKTAEKEPRWTGRGMVEPRDDGPRYFRTPNAFGFDVPTRKVPNIVGGTIILMTDNLSEKEVAAVRGFVGGATGFIEDFGKIHVDNRPWPSPQVACEPEEHSSALNTSLLVALLGILGALGVIAFWSGLAKRRRRVS